MKMESDLEGSAWTLRSVRVDAVMIPIAVESRPAMIAFGDDGRFSGSTGCNNFFGQFTEDEDGLVSGPIGTTMMMCRDAMMVQERHLLTAIEATRGIEVDRDRLVLIGADGAPLVEAQASSEPTDHSPR